MLAADSGWKLDLRRAEVARSSWSWASGKIDSAAFTLRPDGAAWLIEARSGFVRQTGWPELALESAKLRSNGETLFLTESAFRAGSGRLTASGEVNLTRAAKLQAELTQVPLAPLLSPDWRLRLHGDLNGRVRLQADLPAGAVRSEGELQLVHGQLEALPVLEQIASFTRTERFRRIALTKASAVFTHADGVTIAKDVLLESDGLLRVEGGCTIAGDQLDGTFQVGVTAASLQWLPGSQARVFTVQRDGYFWTTLRLTGPVAHPHEDLSRRLMAAAAGELLENGTDTLREAAKTLFDLIPH